MIIIWAVEDAGKVHTANELQHIQTTQSQTFLSSLTYIFDIQTVSNSFGAHYRSHSRIVVLKILRRMNRLAEVSFNKTCMVHSNETQTQWNTSLTAVCPYELVCVCVCVRACVGLNVCFFLWILDCLQGQETPQRNNNIQRMALCLICMNGRVTLSHFRNICLWNVTQRISSSQANLSMSKEVLTEYWWYPVHNRISFNVYFPY